MSPPPREFGDGFKRKQVARAVADLAHETGIKEVTVASIVKRANISHETFSALFPSKADAIHFAFSEAYHHIFDAVRDAGATSEPWPVKLSAALNSFVAATLEAPLFTELCLVHSCGATKEAGRYVCDSGNEVMIQLLSEGRSAARNAVANYSEPPPLTERFLAGGIVSLAAMRVLQGRVEDLSSHRTELVVLAATPFYGIAEATRIGRDLQPLD